MAYIRINAKENEFLTIVKNYIKTYICILLSICYKYIRYN